ncbi:hypothetical protein ARMSODRAFT_953210 [Armillaria solidipes]|uniref:Uncharacterized protein n=1 Tax=Armillaria solidipes TaxID=1076256 RepID=A0A2H3C9G9_9AGAR|nr:hypothetical protein ARMSODRAFT_953210 [Armillaria solidipes]
MAQAGIGRSSCFPRQDPLSVGMHAPTDPLHTFCLSVTTLVTEMNPLHIHMRCATEDFSCMTSPRCKDLGSGAHESTKSRNQ